MREEGSSCFCCGVDSDGLFHIRRDSEILCIFVLTETVSPLELWPYVAFPLSLTEIERRATVISKTKKYGKKGKETSKLDLVNKIISTRFIKRFIWLSDLRPHC